MICRKCKHYSRLLPSGKTSEAVCLFDTEFLTVISGSKVAAELAEINVNDLNNLYTYKKNFGKWFKVLISMSFNKIIDP